MQKFNFVEQLLGLIEDQEAFNQSFMDASDKKKLKALAKKYDYITVYATKISRGERGFEYLKPT
jgi:hypothetical protein